MDLTLNNLQVFIFHKIQPTNDATGNTGLYGASKLFFIFH